MDTKEEANLQITVRGLDPATKAALMQKARQKGVSLNQYALAALKQTAGIETSEERYHRLMRFLSNNHFSAEDAKAMDEALAWSDKASLEKQARDERDLGL